MSGANRPPAGSFRVGRHSAIALLVALALGALLVATTRLVTDRSLGRGAEDLSAARSAFNRLMAARADGVAAQLRFIAAQPGFRAPLAEEPTARKVALMTAMADDYPRQLNAEFCIVTTRHGRWMAMPGWGDRGEPPESLESRDPGGGQRRSAVGDRTGRRPPVPRRVRTGRLRRGDPRHDHGGPRARRQRGARAFRNHPVPGEPRRGQPSVRQQPAGGRPRPTRAPARVGQMCRRLNRARSCFSSLATRDT